MHKEQIDEFSDIVDWLFERAPENATAQVGCAQDNKRATGWYPGRKVASTPVERAVLECSLAGATQLAFPSGTKVLPHGSKGWLSWVGIDIDGKDQVLENWGDVLLKVVPQPWSIRTSSSGNGRHLIARLEEPIECVMEHGTALIKIIAADMLAVLKKIGIIVDKTDRRMFWLVGGLQRWVRQSHRFLKIPELLVEGYLDEIDPLNLVKRPQGPAPQAQSMEGLSSRMREWLAKLRAVDLPTAQGIHQVYVGRVVAWLQAQRFQVKTVSRMRGNGIPNGYLEISRDRISLWSYADGHTIWEWSDIL